MLILVPFLLLFVILGLFWLAGAGLFVGTLTARAPRFLDKIFDHGEKNCACYLGLKHHDHNA